MKVPEFWLKEEFNGWPQHSFIKPVRVEYVAKDLGFYDQDGYTLCYTNDGLMQIPSKLIEEVPSYYK